jgi:hypothetical protein
MDRSARCDQKAILAHPVQSAHPAILRERFETWSEYCLGLIGASYRSVLAPSRLPITPCPVALCPQSAAVPRIAARVARSLP